MRYLRIHLEAPNEAHAQALADKLSAASEGFYKEYLSLKDEKIGVTTVFGDEEWAKSVKDYTKENPVSIKFYASVDLGGAYKIYHSTFENGMEIEEEPEIETILD